MNKQKEYKKKYGDVGVKTFMIIFFSMVIFLIVAFPENITSNIGALVGVLFAIFMIIILGIDLFFTKYEDTYMKLTKCNLFSPNAYRCLFYSPKTGKSTEFICTRELGFELEVNKTYKVVALSGAKNMVFDILEPINDEDIPYEFKSSEYEQKISMMEHNEEKEIAKERNKKIINSVNSLASISHKIQVMIVALIGAGCIFIGLFKSADTMTTIVFTIFGTVLLILSISNLRKSK